MCHTFEFKYEHSSWNEIMLGLVVGIILGTLSKARFNGRISGNPMILGLGINPHGPILTHGNT